MKKIILIAVCSIALCSSLLFGSVVAAAQAIQARLVPVLDQEARLVLVLGQEQMQLPNIPGLDLPTLQLPAIPGLPSSVPILSTPTPATLPQVSEVNVQGLSTNTASAKYGPRENIFSIPDARTEKLVEGRPSYLEVMNAKAFQTYQQNNCTKIEGTNCP